MTRHTWNLPTAVALLAAGWSHAAGPISDDEVKARVERWQPRPEERRFDQIGWAPSLLDAQRLARQHNRPVFLFTYDGATCGIENHRC